MNWNLVFWIGFFLAVNGVTIMTYAYTQRPMEFTTVNGLRAETVNIEKMIGDVREKGFEHN